MTAPVPANSILGHAELRPGAEEGQIVAMPAGYFTAQMVRALPEDGRRYETVHGELLVTPAPRPLHQEVAGRLYERLRAYLRSEPVGHVFLSPADISCGVDTLVQPDLFVVPLEQAQAMRWEAMTRLLLAVEILSPGTAHADRFTKRRLYQEAGVGSYWVVDPERWLVEVWTPGLRLPMVERERVRWRPAGSTTDFEVAFPELFRALP